MNHPDPHLPQFAGATVDLSPAESGPNAPSSMSAEEVDAAHRQSRELVESVRDATGGRQLAIIDEVTAVGMKSQRNAGRQLELVNTRLATFLDQGGSSSAVASDLVDLRMALDRINPAASQRGFLSRIGSAVPFLRNRSLVRALTKIAIRYEPVAEQVAVIETRLRQGRNMLLRDNVELRQLYEDIETQQAVIQRQAFLGEVLLVDFGALLDQVADPAEHERIQIAVHDITVRVQDLHTMLQVHAQYFVSIELTRQNNARLGNAVDRTVSLATSVVTVGLAIQAALVRQRKVQEATQRTREFLGEVITQNAAAIRQQTDAIGNLYSDPVIAMDKLTQAHHDLLAALDAAKSLREQSIATARTNIEQLKTLTTELDEHVHGIERTEERPS